MLCAIAIIDPAAAARLTELRRIAERSGVPPRDVHGHITLATYIGADEAGFISSCKAILSGRPKFPVCYHAVEVWASESGTKSLIVAAPRKDPAIAAIQREIARACPAGLNKWTREDAWKPHTSLLYVPGADLSPVAEAMRQAFEPFVTQVDRIEFSRVYENQGKFSYETAETILLE